MTVRATFDRLLALFHVFHFFHLPPSMKPRILVIDDEAGDSRLAADDPRVRGLPVLGAAGGQDGAGRVQRERPDLVLLDIKMPGMDGMEVLRKLHALDETLPVVMISGHGTTATAVEAIRSGAIDFLDKPLSSERVHRDAAERAASSRELRSENRELKLAMESKYEIVGQSPALRTVLDVGASARRRPTPPCCCSARAASARSSSRARSTATARAPAQRFVQVNCAAIPEELIESELFGHEKGSFTGATEKQIGKFEQADRGTIFLDEVGDMSPKTQAKVLRVLQEQEVERLGSARTIKVDVRVIAATNKNLEEAIERGEFREDLFFRLNVIPIVVPPLRERRDDIPLLVQHFARRTGDEHNVKPKRFDAAAMEALQRYRWRGNIRELRNTIERLMIMTPGDVVRVEDLPADMRTGDVAPARYASAACRRARGGAAPPTAAARPRRRHAARVQGRRRAGLSGAEAAREQLEHLEDRRGHRHAAQQSLQEARTVRHQAGRRRLGPRAPARAVAAGAGACRLNRSVAVSQTTAGCLPSLRPDNRGSPRSASRGGKSELRRAVRRVTPGQGNLTDSGTENIPPAFAPWRFGKAGRRRGGLPAEVQGRRRVRVKRCGKSAPRRR